MPLTLTLLLTITINLLRTLTLADLSPPSTSLTHFTLFNLLVVQ